MGGWGEENKLGDKNENNICISSVTCSQNSECPSRVPSVTSKTLWVTVRLKRKKERVNKKKRHK